MPKKNDESFLDYKKRVMDPISSTYCAAKWYNATIWLQGGYTTSCHSPLPHKVCLKDVNENPAALHNTFEKIIDRRFMLKGRRSPGCTTCWKIEDLNDPAIISDRTYKTVIYSDDDIFHSHSVGKTTDNYIPRNLEISFSSICNLACSYCNSSFSSRWVKDISTNGYYTGLTEENSEKINHEGSEFIEFDSNEENNPYVKAFWKWWPELKTKLQELRITGGEPLLSKNTWQILDLFQKEEYRTISIAINTNLSVSNELISRFIKVSHKVDNLDLYTSCEAVGKQAEYIRDGLKFDEFIKNLNNVIENGNFRSVHIMLTINALSLFSLVEFLDVVVKLKERYKSNHPAWTLNIIKFPSFMGPLVLPFSIRERLVGNLQSWLAVVQNNEFVSDMEIDHVYRLIQYLKQGEPDNIMSLSSDFKAFFTQFDRRRSKNIVDTVPDVFGEWFNKL